MNDTKLAPLAEPPATDVFTSVGLDVWTAPTAHVTSMASAENHVGKYYTLADMTTNCIS
jgi:hypothetical protein